MSLPADLALVPVAIRTFVNRAGTIMAGKRITATLDTEVSVGLTTIVPKRLTITLDADGKVPAGTTLPSTNDPDLNITGLAYTVEEKWSGGRKGLLTVPYDAASVDLADLVDTVAPPSDTAAQSAAAAAAASATTAAAAATSAAASADAAAASETAAGDSEAAAAAAASTATAQAAAAGTAKDAAVAAQAAAETARNGATTAKSGADAAQAAAEAAQAGAQSAADTATTQAGIATASADAASASADAAAALIAGTALLRHGTGAPDNALGNNGDYYLDDAAPKMLYGPKAAGAWPAGVSLKGATGDTGPTGPTGATGATGRLPNVQTVVSAATVTPTFADDLVKIMAQGQALALANPTGTPIPGLGIVIRIKDDGTARAISYGTQYRAIGLTLPATTVPGKTLYLGCIWNDTDTKLDVLSVGQQA